MGRRLRGGLLAGALACVASPAGALAGVASPAGAQQDVFYSDLAPGVAAKTELAGGDGFDEILIVELYFYASTADSSGLEIDVIKPGNRSTMERVFALTSGSGTTAAFVERCRLRDRIVECRPLQTPALFQQFQGDSWGEFLEIEIPRQRIDWGGEFLHLTLPAGAFTLSGYEDEAEDGSLIVRTDAQGAPIRRDSPAIQAPLPALTDLERQYLEQRPFFRFEASPLVRNQKTGGGGFEDLSLSFDGGIYRPLAGGNALWQTKWSGAIATDAGVNFNHLTLETGAAVNLLPGDWLPLTLSAKGQADQAFESADLLAEARLAYVLPFNINLQSGEYRPGAAPLINLVAAYGAGLSRPDSLRDAAGETVAPSTPEEAFVRVGYEARWRVPLGSQALLRLHHAGLWNDPRDVGGEWHFLWDLSFEIDVGGVTYLVGYQRGEAAPLFLPIETTRLGLAFAIGEP